MIVRGSIARALMVAGLVFARALAYAQPAASEWQYRALDLVVTIEPAKGELRIAGTGEIETITGGTSDLRLRVNGDWYTLDVTSVSIPGATIDMGTVDPAHKNWRVAVAHFPKPLAAGSILPVRFELTKAHNAFPLAVTANVAVAISEAIWYPVPLDGLSALPSGLITFRIPPDWHVAPMGTLMSARSEGNQRIEVFRTSRNRRRAFIAAAYTRSVSKSATGTNEIYLLAAPIDSAALLKAFDSARTFLENKYGPLPFADYRVAEMPDDAVPWYGASEEGLIISRTEMMRSEAGLLGNLVHELAHSWWGNKVAPNGPGGLLLNEGMASFSGMAFSEARQGTPRTIEGTEFGSATASPDATVYGYMQLWRAGKDVAISRLKAGVGDHYNIAQTKGVWILRMLQERLGAEAFYGTLRRIVETTATLSLDDFRTAMSGATKEDLRPFLSQWLDQPGIPVLDVRWRNDSREDKTHTTISLFQSQSGQPYTLPVELKLRTRKGIVLKTIDIAGDDTKIDFDVPDEVVGIEVDPDHKLLLWRPEYGPPPSASR
jgi:hypothetical protein